jgi:hypothetical protein
MHQTPEQRKILSSTWIAAIVFTVIYSVIYFWREPAGEFTRSFPRLKLGFLFPYILHLVLWAAWSWDWIVTRKYVKAGLMLIAVAGIWALGMYVVKRVPPANSQAWQHIRFTYLLSPLLWVPLVKGFISFNWREMKVAALSGITVILLFTILNEGRFGIVVFIAPYLEMADELFHSRKMIGLARMLLSSDARVVSYIFIFALYVFTVQWIYQFFNNFFDKEQRPAAKGIFGGSFPPVSGRYFATLFPVVYLLTIASATSSVMHTLYLLKEESIRGAFDFAEGNLPMIYPGTTGTSSWMMAPLCIFFTVLLFRVLRTLTQSRCISLHQKFGFSYLLAFIPILNIIPWVMLSVARTPNDETARMQYAAVMNNGAQQRSTFTINLLITLAVIGTIMGLFRGSGILGVLLLFLSLILYIGFVYRPEMLYWLVTIKILLLVIIFFSHYISRSNFLLLCFSTTYSILMLSWQKKIFFPDVEMDVELVFDGESEGAERSSS